MGTDGAGTASARFGLDISRPALVSALVFAIGCASGAPAAEPARTPKASGFAAYLPLEDATVFSYATTTEPAGERGLLVLEIRRPRAEVAELVVAGRVRRMNVTAQGIAHVTGGFLLRAPLAVGENWQGDFGHVRVTSIDRKVAVPAGRFEGCVETVEEMTTNAGTKRTTTAYCPGIGIALRETEAEQEGERAVERIALKSYGKRF
ncbi:MAG TPA: hypothetical protein VGK73_33550 [Polyangiaceae bacterium]